MDQLENMRALSARKQAALQRLIAPAKAAMAQMLDAGMKNGADPLATVLFELDAIEQEIRDVFSADPKGLIDAFIQSMRDQKG